MCESMTQLEAMEYVTKNLSIALGYIATAKAKYELYLSERRFAEKEINLLTESYENSLTVWHNMHKRKQRERGY